MDSPMVLHPSLDILFPYASATTDPGSASEFSLCLTEGHSPI